MADAGCSCASDLGITAGATGQDALDAAEEERKKKLLAMQKGYGPAASDLFGGGSNGSTDGNSAGPGTGTGPGAGDGTGGE